MIFQSFQLLTVSVKSPQDAAARSLDRALPAREPACWLQLINMRASEQTKPVFSILLYAKHAVFVIEIYEHTYLPPAFEVALYFSVSIQRVSHCI